MTRGLVEGGGGWGLVPVVGAGLLSSTLVNGLKWALTCFVTACICLTATGACLHRLLQSDSVAVRIYESCRHVLYHVGGTCVQIRCPPPGL